MLFVVGPELLQNDSTPLRISALSHNSNVKDFCERKRFIYKSKLRVRVGGRSTVFFHK